MGTRRILTLAEREENALAHQGGQGVRAIARARPLPGPVFGVRTPMSDPWQPGSASVGSPAPPRNITRAVRGFGPRPQRARVRVRRR